MNTGFPVLDRSFKVSTSDELTSDYRVVKGSSADTITVCGANEKPLGIAQCYQGADGDALDAGEPVNVRMLGISKAVAAGNIALFDSLKPAAAGTVTPATAIGDQAFAIALEAATVGQIFDVFVIGSHAPVATVGVAIQLPGGLSLVVLDTAITANSTTTSAAAGSLGITSHGTGVGKLFVSDGTKWQLASGVAAATITFANGQTLTALTTAITADSTTTTEPVGSLAITSHGTGVGKLFVSDGAKWQYVGVA